MLTGLGCYSPSKFCLCFHMLACLYTSIYTYKYMVKNVDSLLFFHLFSSLKEAKRQNLTSVTNSERVMWRSLNTTLGFFWIWYQSQYQKAGLVVVGNQRCCAELMCSEMLPNADENAIAIAGEEWLACKWISSTAKRKSNWNIIWSKFASVTKERAIWGTKLRETQWIYNPLEKEKMGKFFTMAVFSCFFMLPDHRLSLCPTHCVHSSNFLYSAAL